ncbi:MAG TPA: DNA polymerase II small subunit [Candidatus Woesearchaeota archaeon]|nr:DNA polymerase II small subunit [Candidatus Woesearchaeota archaeon]
MHGATTIRKIYSAPDKERVNFIAMVLDMSLTRNNNYILNLEDQTGTIKAIVTKTKKELFEQVRSITQDEVLGVQGTKSDKVVFVNSLITPDTPLNKELKKTPDEIAAVFISDLHFGSKAFLEKSLNKFVAWINKKTGTKHQKELVEKIKYLFIVGDLVEGIGIYPGQEKELLIKDLYAQYAAFSDFILKIPSHIKIIICPGNHDSLRIAEPQPALPKEYVPSLLNKENILFVSNPSVVNIASSGSFSGLDVLMYHGFSFPFYADKIEKIRTKGGLENTGSIMKHLLRKRHLAPTHGSTQYQPGYLKDPLLIKSTPDFFVSGHVHRSSVDTYRNITLLNCSCWVSQTPYQERRGLVPEPARAIYVNLKTRKITVLNFLEK